MTMKFPFVENTLGKKLEAGTGLSVDCLIAALVSHLGPDHGAMHWDLVKVIY
ncbi:hypothetical protein [Mesorhizobium sp.]|uniref:hypothetical protein n=1 Tax=Mesorhizobium sp. TaxID=1871066 RepID=UPI0025BA6133|nr:hypothetical protein [Mesorhizobium sp.]